MRVVIQRVLNASVHVNKIKVSSIKKGLLVFVGFEVNDNTTDCDWIANKILNLRIFSSKENKMELDENDMVIEKDADTKSLPELEKSILEYSEKARDSKLTIDEMQGGTFTISNGGVFGFLLSTPILNAPQTAILGMHAIQERPVAVNGEIVIRPMMYLAMSYDHRLLDGKEAVRFLVSIKEQLESPERLQYWNC